MDERKMNILVIGNSGCGKSTLIQAISGAEIKTGIGEGQTQQISVYESSTWPFRFIDTKGFEYSRLEQLKTIWQVIKFTREQIALARSGEEEAAGIDAVWYCIEGTSRRTFSYNIQMMNLTIRRWKNVPVFAVITKSYSEADIEENITAVTQAFARSRGKGINLQKIIPVVAKPYIINEEMVVGPRGIEELCAATLDCFDDAVAISDENRTRMVLEQKRFTANMLTTGAAGAAVIVGAVPISFADSLILVPLEIALTKGILRVYDIGFSGELVTAIVGSTAITNVARSAVSALKAIPNIAGSVINAVVAGFFVAALGEAVIALSEAIHSGVIDKAKIDSVVEFLTEKLAGNKVFGKAVTYISDNSKALEGKTAEEIFSVITDAVKPDKE